jgi:hypothetical protein
MKQVASRFLLGIFFDPEDEVTWSSEISIDSQWATWCYTPENRALGKYLI